MILAEHVHETVDGEFWVVLPGRGDVIEYLASATLLEYCPKEGLCYMGLDDIVIGPAFEARIAFDPEEIFHKHKGESITDAARRIFGERYENND